MKTNVYILEGLDCENSVSKLEQEIRTINGLKNVSIIFAAKQMYVTAKNPDALMKEIEEVIAKVAPSVTITKKKSRNLDEEIVIDYHYNKSRKYRNRNEELVIDYRHNKRRKGVRRKKSKNTRKYILAVLWLCAFVIAGLYSCKTVLKATEMRLAEYEGTVTVLNSRKKDVLLKEQMPLYSGYMVKTGSDGIARILLDDTKLILLSTDGQAKIESTKGGKHLTITADPAVIFFAITEKLEEDETLYFKNRNSVIAIRGTVGIYRQIADNESQILVLEGAIDFSDLNQSTTKTVTTGQTADVIIQSDGSADITVRQILSGDIPAFVSDELMQNEEVVQQIKENGGTIEYPEKADFVYENSDGPVRREGDEENPQESRREVDEENPQEPNREMDGENPQEPNREADGENPQEPDREADGENPQEPSRNTNEGTLQGTQMNTDDENVEEVHTWKVSYRVAATCEQDGYVDYRCDGCAEIKTEILKAKGTHTWRESFRVAATCEQNGYVDYECSDCAETKTEITENATGHKWEDIIDTVEVEEDVKKYFYRCDGCGEKWYLDGDDDMEALGLWEGHVSNCPEGGITFSRDYEYVKEVTYVYLNAVVGKYCTDCGYEIEIPVDETYF